MRLKHGKLLFQLQTLSLYLPTPMPCLCCLGGRPEAEVKMPRTSFSVASSVQMGRRGSVYQIEQPFDIDVDDARTRNAQQIRMQRVITEELCAETYGLEVVKKGDEPYEAQDFFAFKEILGSGSTAVVFRAVFKPTGHPLAVKFIPNFKSAKTMVMRELKVLKLANECRFLIDFHSHFRVGQNLYFVMEVCEGGTLEELIQPRYHLPAKLMKIYLKEIASALFFLHGQRLVHRDVAPPNLFIDATGHLRLGDFGLCRIVDDPQGEIMTDCGKPYIKAPEIYMDKPCSFGMDWWSVGIMVYRFITGNFPFRTEKLTQGYQSVTKHQEKYPEWAFVDLHAKNLCQGLLIKKPKERLASDNETSAIKGHPYFQGVDWDVREDVIAIARSALETPDDSNTSIVLAKLLTSVGVAPPSVQQSKDNFMPLMRRGSRPLSPGTINKPNTIMALLPKGDGHGAGGKLFSSHSFIKETTV